MKGTIVGQISQIADTQKVGANDFPVRELILKTVEEKPNFYVVQFVGEKTELLDNFKPDEVVKIKCFLKGREYTNDEGKYNVFMSLNGWDIEKN